MLYHLDFQVEHATEQTQRDLFIVWAAEAALNAERVGILIDF